MDPGMAETLGSAMAATESAGSVVSSGNLIINIILGSSLKYLWSMINTLQFVVFFTEWQNVQIPTNAEMVLFAFRTIALGEFIPYEKIINPVK